ncbi:hypothetical protein PP583_gp59 [Pseudoalteromonas phage HS6]|nr:hypothetical protein PP583_gp59 [Pseudoalteromonas phage HS6]
MINNVYLIIQASAYKIKIQIPPFY